MGLKTAMTEEKLEHLVSLGFEWEVKATRENELWNTRFEELTHFKEKHGHCRVPRLNKKLHKWVENLRSSYDKKLNGEKGNCMLDDARLAKLNSAGILEDLKRKYRHL